MTTRITAQQCKQELENILMDAVENGNFNYKVEVSKKNYYGNGYFGLGQIMIAIKGKENETKEIFVDTDYTALDTEDVRIASVLVRDLQYWNKSCWGLYSEWTENNNKEGECYLYKDNYLITQLILAQRLPIAKRLTTARDKKKCLKYFSSLTIECYKEFADDAEFYIIWDDSIYNPRHVKCSNLGDFFYFIYELNEEKAYAQDGVELNYCMYFKMTGAEIKKMFNK